METFKIQPERYIGAAGSKTTIKKPTEIAYFSYDSEHGLHTFSTKSLRYYYPPSIDPQNPPDLSKGFDTFRNRDDTADEHLDGLLDTLEVAERRQGERFEIDLITWRGMMTKILTAAFSPDDRWEMNATRFEETIFIEESHEAKLDEKRRQLSQGRGQRGPPQELAMFWGYKFETLAMLDKPWPEASRTEIERREDAVVENFSQYCSIVRTAMGPTSMIIGGEVDGVLGFKPEDPKDTARWIELKTARPPESRRDWEIHDKKMLKFWAQSFLLGVPKVIVGYRTRSGHLSRIEELETHRIPPMVQQHGTFKWNGNTCINMAAAFLDFLKQVVVGDGVWKIVRTPNISEIQIRKVEESGNGGIIKPSFLAWRRELALKKGTTEYM